jgi:hypothetical protein
MFNARTAKSLHPIRWPNLNCPIVYVVGAFEGLYVLEANGKLRVHAD